MKAPELRLFVSYSHRDDFWMRVLMPLLQFPGMRVKPWNDEEIRPGVRWDAEIHDALSEMDIFIPLVSVNFAVSRYISDVECRIAKERHEKNEIEVVPVLVHDPGKNECGWLMEFQRVPPGPKSWAEVRKEFPPHDMALTPIRDGIRAVVERARNRHSMNRRSTRR